MLRQALRSQVCAPEPALDSAEPDPNPILQALRGASLRSALRTHRLVAPRTHAIAHPPLSRTAHPRYRAFTA